MEDGQRGKALCTFFPESLLSSLLCVPPGFKMIWGLPQAVSMKRASEDTFVLIEAVNRMQVVQAEFPQPDMSPMGMRKVECTAAKRQSITPQRLITCQQTLQDSKELGNTPVLATTARETSRMGGGVEASCACNWRCVRPRVKKLTRHKVNAMQRSLQQKSCWSDVSKSNTTWRGSRRRSNRPTAQPLRARPAWRDASCAAEQCAAPAASGGTAASPLPGEP